jgi:outer membrane murein-binding lipoprotein Lpp
VRRSALSSVFVLVLVASGCGDDEPSPDAAAEERVEELEGEVEDLRARVDDLEAENEALETELGAVREDEPNDEDAAEDEDPAEDEQATAPLEWPSEVAQEWTAEGLVEQLRVHVRDVDEIEMPEGWEPGMTAWVPFEVPEAVAGTYETPGEIMVELAAVIDAPLLGQDQWETTVRVLADEDDPDLAYGALLAWGFLDDSVIGRDVRITLTRTDDGWEPGGAEQRQHCMRGVSGDQTACT